MKSFSTLSVAIASAIATLAAPAFAAPLDEYALGRIIIEPRAGLSADEMGKFLKPHRGKARKMGQSNVHVIEVPAGAEMAVAGKLRNNPHFKFAELDRRVLIAAASNDPYAGSEWHLGKINAQTAWDSSQGAGVTIAILDSGQDATHPDLMGNTVAGYNAYEGNTNTADVCGHGTKVAGAAAAASNNAVGVAGVAGKAKIMPIRIAFYNAGCYAYFSTMAAGVTWAADHGARVVNISYSAVASSTAVQSAANYLRSKGGLLFVSAGNNAKDEAFTPTSTMIPVSSTDSADNLSGFSSWGNFVALSAPGSGIYTTVPGGGYGSVNGTSFASPIAASVAALVMSANPALTADQVQNILFTTAVDLGTPGRDNKFGYGRVNAAAAVAAAKGGAPVADTTAPTVAITSPGASSSVSGLVSIGVNATDNVGVSRVDLKVNGTVVASDTAAPYAFSWDSNGVANGVNNLIAIAYDAAGNVKNSSIVPVSVANNVIAPVADTTPPVVKIINPIAGKVTRYVSVNVNASDNSGAAGITMTLYIDGKVRTTGKGSQMTMTWDSTLETVGTHVLQAVAKDAAGNISTTSVEVTR